ncbi:hypothetical protein CRU87_06440 [Aliarcobacter trophiarum LMG 25534]|uniref:Penicillin-binding protein activator n=1 Tax=Aliarcobacter trophiarum LMG 25534 TaxID=1032241 RepID=A0AAD0VLV5_9BACT|nr:hypothetical protein [Aliarcobacter trophiarum]AXK48647.1 hypothetical protein ATR_0778 [Aliarcobacter trophiarum LMG 25534]RXI27383.1 hypothetical protein CRU89_06015 [Aliarcobacter trophiarum]RXJ91022.1 hypothetical protein CRU87_06440 [Aliarcobacter trophiarum LMG 25534]
MKKLVALIFMAFLLAGCTQKVVKLKMPQNVPAKKVDEDKKTVVEEFISNDSVIQEEIINNSGSKNEITSDEDSEALLSNEMEIKFDSTKANLKVAFVYPSSLVSKYARNSINTTAGYLSFIEANYNLVVIDSQNESMDSINKAFEKVKEAGITKVIALFTPNAINNINSLALDDIMVYLPLIEKKDSLATNNSLIFGSISYEDQLKKLSYYSDGPNVLFYQDTYLGNKLRNSYENTISYTTARKEVRKNETNFKSLVSDSRLRNSSLFLNVDIVKSSLIMSQLRANDIYPKFIFSTQINFDPILMTLTQDKDRERLVLANSIDKLNPKLRDEIINFGGNINFEWVDYSTLVGISYLINGNNSFMPTKIVENQVVYNPRLFKSTDYGFVEIK